MFSNSTWQSLDARAVDSEVLEFPAPSTPGAYQLSVQSGWDVEVSACEGVADRCSAWNELNQNFDLTVAP